MKTRSTLFTALFVLSFSTAFSQLRTDSLVTAGDLVAAIVGNGLTITDISVSGVPGSYGIYDARETVVGTPQGILLTTGSIANAAGPNNQGGISGANISPGDADLDNLPGVSATQDACVLEFNLVPEFNTLRLNYIFASEEYLEFVGAFNDVFAVFLTGPDSVTRNIALVPGTSEPVSINTVNDMVNSQYFISNGSGADAPFNASDKFIQYDGYTTILEASATVIPEETYRLKIAIADDLDAIFDSGLFIEGGSLTSSPACDRPDALQALNVTPTGADIDWNNVSGANTYLIRGKRTASRDVNNRLKNVSQLSINDLAPGKSYQVRVRAKCGVEVFSGLSDVLTFETPEMRLPLTAAADEMPVYPNPSSGLFYLDSDFMEEAVMLIFDASGRLVKEVNNLPPSGGYRIDLSNEMPGVYFMHIRQGETIKKARLMLVE